MLAKIGLLALAVIVGSESFAFSGAILWPTAVYLHLGRLFEEGAIGAAVALGLAAGFAIYRLALKHENDEKKLPSSD